MIRHSAATSQRPSSQAVPVGIRTRQILRNLERACTCARALCRNSSPYGVSARCHNEAETELAGQVVTSEAVTAQETYSAALLSMTSETENGTAAALAGRWERWAAPALGEKEVQLASSGEVVYVMKPGVPPGHDTDKRLSGQFLLAEDATPMTIVGIMQDKQQAVVAKERRASDTFNVTDVAVEMERLLQRCSDALQQPCRVSIQPQLPDLSKPQEKPTAGLRVLAGNHHGFAMVATYLPQELFGQQRQGGSAGNSMVPFVANLYVKHPSSTPGVGHRWGFNIQYNPDHTLQHVHHTSMGIVEIQDVESALKPGVHKPELLTPLKHKTVRSACVNAECWLPKSIDAFMSENQPCEGSVIKFTYDGNGQLRRKMIDSCTYSSSSSGGDRLESWYSSGGYSKVPKDVGVYAKAGKAIVVEAGAIVPDRKNNKAEYVTRWLLRYKTDNGQIDSARIEVYEL